MIKNDREKYAFISSLLTSLLLFLMTYLQFKKEKPFRFVILFVALVMAISAYKSYKKIKK